MRSARSSKWARFGALAVSFGLVAAACSDKKDEDSVGGGTTEATGTTTADTGSRDDGAGRVGCDHVRPVRRHHRDDGERGWRHRARVPPQHAASAGGRAGRRRPTRRRRRGRGRCAVDTGQRAVRLVLPDAHPHVLRATGRRRPEPRGSGRSSPRASSPTRTTRSGRSSSARASPSPTARRSTPTRRSTTSTAASSG